MPLESDRGALQCPQPHSLMLLSPLALCPGGLSKREEAAPDAESNSQDEDLCTLFVHDMNKLNLDSSENSTADLELAAMRAIHMQPPKSQRELAHTLGISVGKANFLLRALLEKGVLKVENLRRNDNKLGYLYLITPKGLREKARLTQAFLIRKEQEYLQLRAQIDHLKRELDSR